MEVKNKNVKHSLLLKIEKIRRYKLLHFQIYSSSLPGELCQRHLVTSIQYSLKNPLDMTIEAGKGKFSYQDFLKTFKEIWSYEL